MRHCQRRMIDTNDVQVVSAGSAGIGTWYLPVSQYLQLSISVATLVFIIVKTIQLIKRGNNGGDKTT